MNEEIVKIEVRKIPIPNLGVGPVIKKIIHINKIFTTENIIFDLSFLILKNKFEKIKIIKSDNRKFVKI